MAPLSTTIARAFPSGSSMTSHLPTPKNITIPRINPQPTAATSASTRPRRRETVPEFAWLSTSVRRMLSRPAQVVNPHRSRYTVHSIFQRRMHAGGRHWRGGISLVASLRPFARRGMGGPRDRQFHHRRQRKLEPSEEQQKVSVPARRCQQVAQGGQQSKLRTAFCVTRQPARLFETSHRHDDGGL